MLTCTLVGVAVPGTTTLVADGGRYPIRAAYPSRCSPEPAHGYDQSVPYGPLPAKVSTKHHKSTGRTRQCFIVPLSSSATPSPSGRATTTSSVGAGLPPRASHT